MSVIDTYYHALSRVVPGTPVATSKTLNRVLHGLVYERVRKPRLGLFEPDDLLGWSHRPDVRTVHPSFEFRVTYTTEHDGRRTGGYNGVHARLIVLGCSWAFGHGVDDDDTAAARLTTEHDVPAHNFACMGYGPAQSYLMLARRMALAELSAGDALVAYIWTPDQLMRAWRRRSWVELNAWVNPHGPSHPVFDLVAGQLHHVGLIGTDDAVSDPILLPGVTERMEWRITLALIESMADLVASAGRRFLVVLPPIPARERDLLLKRRMRALLAQHAISFLDIDGPTAGRSAPGPLFYRFDGHPTRYWHAAVADALAGTCRIGDADEGDETL